MRKAEANLRLQRYFTSPCDHCLRQAFGALLLCGRCRISMKRVPERDPQYVKDGKPDAGGFQPAGIRFAFRYCNRGFFLLY